MLQAGIIDPTKVERVGVAGMRRPVAFLAADDRRR